MDAPRAKNGYAAPASRENPIPPTAYRLAIEALECPATTIAIWRTVPSREASTSPRTFTVPLLVKVRSEKVSGRGCRGRNGGELARWLVGR
jgi:hypothetical protein